MATDALITLDQVVSRFMLKYELLPERAVSLTEHAANCLRDYYLYDAPDLQISKLSVNTLSTNVGYVTMPDDMIGFNGIAVPMDGEWWHFTQKDSIVNTTTTTLGIESVDTAFGEGEGITDPKNDTYGGVGGVNDYYYKVDWDARRIYTEGISTGTVAVMYTSSGVTASGTTYLPEFITPMLDAYLLWKLSIMNGDVRSEQLREKSFEKSELKVRGFINSMTYSEWSDLFASLTTQSPQR